MKKVILALIFVMLATALFAGRPHPVLYKLKLANDTMPAVADIKWKAERVGIPNGSTLYYNYEGENNSPGSTTTEYASISSVLVKIQCGDFVTPDWNEGDIVKLTVTHMPTGAMATCEVTTTTAGSDTYMGDGTQPDVQALYLQPVGPTTWAISGNVDGDVASNIAGVEVKAYEGDTAIATATTDVNGDYAFDIEDNKTITLKATKIGWTFPMIASFTVTADAADKNFMGISDNPGMPTNPFPNGNNVAMGTILHWHAPVDGASVTSYKLVLNISGSAPLTFDNLTETEFDLSTVPQITEGSTVNASVVAFYNPEAVRNANGKASSVRGWGEALTWHFKMGVSGSAGGNDNAQAAGNYNNGNGNANVNLPPVDGGGSEEFDTNVTITPGAGTPSEPIEVTVTTNYGQLGSAGNGDGFVIGLNLSGENAWFSGVISFDLGTNPTTLFNLGNGGYLAYKTAGEWVELTPGNNPLQDNQYRIIGTVVKFKPAAVGRGDLVFAGGTENFTLPVELSSFTCAFMTTQNQVNIKWVTASEINVNGYLVLRSEDTNFTNSVNVTPVMIPATGGSSTAKYSVFDNEVEAGKTYNYRLQSFENDGTVNYFGPITIEIPINHEGNDVNVPTAMLAGYPNPFNSSKNTNFNVRFNANKDEQINVKVYNVKGQLITSGSKYSNGTKDQNFTLKLKNLPSGIYFYRMEAKNFKQTNKLLIIK